MALSLYALTVPTFLQTVTAVGGFLDRAAAHCTQAGVDPDDFVGARLGEATLAAFDRDEIGGEKLPGNPRSAT